MILKNYAVILYNFFLYAFKQQTREDAYWLNDHRRSG